MARFATLALVAGCCHGQWRHTLAVYDAAAAACDTSETLEFSNYGRWNLGRGNMPIEEANPVLGATPSPLTLLAWLAVAELGVFAVHHYEGKATDVALVAVGVVETTANVLNVRYAGLCGIGPTNLQDVRPTN